MSLETEVPVTEKTEPGKSGPRRRLPPSLAAWLVLLVCFGLFCGLTWLILSSVMDYLSHSVQPQKATVTALSASEVSVRHAGQDRFLLISQNQSEPLNEGDLVRTAQGSRAIVQLMDGTSLDLASNSEVELLEHQVKTTNFVQKEKRVVFRVGRGTVTVKLEPFSSKDYSKSLVKATLLDEAEILFNDPVKGNYPAGTYTIDLDGNGTTTGWLASLPTNPSPIDVKGAGQVLSLAPRQKVKLEQGAAPILPPRDERELIKNNAFIDGLDFWKEQHDQGGDGGATQGRVLPDSEMIDDGTITRAHILRYESQGNFEESSLHQDINVDVRDYNSLLFKFKGRISKQSLAGGGIFGNEYPLFIKIYYTDRDGQARQLFRGFYFKAADANTRTFDRAGNEQLLGSQQWRENKWEEFQIDLAQLRQKPAYINAIEIGSAGHDFESYFTEVYLTAKSF
jgi:hypothetical protein